MGKRREMISPYKCSHISQLIENRHTAGGFKWDKKHFKCWNFELENICTDHQLNICNPKPILWATYTWKVSDFQVGAAKPVSHFYVVAHSSSFTSVVPSYISYPFLAGLTSGLIQTYIPVISTLKSTACFYCCKFSWPFSKQRSSKKQFIDSLGSRISQLPSLSVRTLLSTQYSKLFAPAHRQRQGTCLLAYIIWSTDCPGAWLSCTFHWNQICLVGSFVQDQDLNSRSRSSGSGVGITERPTTSDLWFLAYWAPWTMSWRTEFILRGCCLPTGITNEIFNKLFYPLG